MRKLFRIEHSIVELHIINDIFGKRPCAYIHVVKTEPRYRRRGLASQLAKQAVEYARAFGCYKIFLVCHKRNVRFYRKLGFKAEQIGMVLRFD